MDTETGLYYLMSRYYDPVTHRFVNSDGYFQSGNAILDANMNAYCRNNPIMYSDPTGEHAKCGSPTCLICNKSRRDFINSHVDWYNRVTGSNIIGVTSTGQFLYVVYKDRKNNIDDYYYNNSIFVGDYRNNNDPNIQIINSVAITEYNLQYEILEMIQAYNQENPSSNAWNRTTKDMIKEWDAHNFMNNPLIAGVLELVGQKNVLNRTKDVDLNNADQGNYDIILMW